MPDKVKEKENTQNLMVSLSKIKPINLDDLILVYAGIEPEIWENKMKRFIRSPFLYQSISGSAVNLY